MTTQLERQIRQAQRKEEDAKFDSSPIWKSLEKIGREMKAWYEKNEWVFFDKEAMAVLESYRKDYEEHQEKIEDAVKKGKSEAHDRIEQDFNRMHDKKLLQLQLKSMQREFATLKKLEKLQNKHKENGTS